MAIKKVTSQLRAERFSSWPGRTVYAASADWRTRDTREAAVAVAGVMTPTVLRASLVFRRRGMAGETPNDGTSSQTPAIRC